MKENQQMILAILASLQNQNNNILRNSIIHKLVEMKIKIIMILIKMIRIFDILTKITDEFKADQQQILTLNS